MIPKVWVHYESKGEVNEGQWCWMSTKGSNRILIGCLMYLTAKSPGILYDVNGLSLFLNSSSELHIQAVKIVLTYVKGTRGYGINLENAKILKFKDFLTVIVVVLMKAWKVKLQGIFFVFGAGCFSWCSKNMRLLFNQLKRQNSLLLHLRSINLMYKEILFAISGWRWRKARNIWGKASFRWYF